MAERSVVITGVGAVSPLGTGADVLHRRWLAGELGLHDGEGTCRDFDPGSVLSTKEVRRADRFTQLALVAADEALRAAGWTARVPVEADRVSCVIGTGIGGLGTLEAQHDVLRTQGARRLSPLAIPLLMANAAAAAIARRHDLHGPALAPVAACASGANAIGDGARLIRAGAVDAAVVGGAEATLTEFARAAFAEMGASSPSGACRPFDARRDGFVMGEGAGVLVLERREAALARGAPVLGSVDGYWCTVDGYHLSAPEPEGRYAAGAIRGALDDAGWEPEDVDYVNAHGTSTPLNDRAEASALRLALGERASAVPVSSTKSTIGHLLGAGGAVEAVATVLALRAGVAPPTLGFEQPDPHIDLDVVADGPRVLRARPGQPLRALSNSFGFGGHNATLALSALPLAAGDRARR